MPDGIEAVAKKYIHFCGKEVRQNCQRMSKNTQWLRGKNGRIGQKCKIRSFWRQTTAGRGGLAVVGLFNK